MSKNYKVYDEEVSIVIAVINEAEHISSLVNDISSICDKTGLRLLEIIFVDDGSSDGTIQKIKESISSSKPFNIELITRNVRYGLANAQLVGAKSAKGDLLIFMDGDCQHPVTLLPTIVNSLKKGKDLIIASRYIKGGESVWNPVRGFISRVASLLTRMLLFKYRGIKDPASGYFGIRKKYVSNLDTIKNKIKLLPYIMVSNDLTIEEIPFKFNDRLNGHSKLVDSKSKFILNYLTELVYYMRIMLNGQI